MPDRETRLRLKPQVNISPPTSIRMWLVCGCAFFVVVQSAVGDSGASLSVAFAALIAAVMAELLMTYSKHGFSKIRDGSAAASAMVLALLLPNQIHPLYAALGAAFAMIVVKHSFGGLGANWLNPALAGWLFIRFSWPLAVAGALDGSGEYLTGTESAADQIIRGFFNKAVFPFLGAELPPGYIDLFSLQSPGIIADRAVLILILGAIVIAAFQISRSWLSAVYLMVFGLLVRMLGDLPQGGAWWNGDIILAFCSGGTLAAAFILVIEPSSGAKSVLGNIITVVLAAVLSFTFRFWGNEVYGCFFAIVLVNALTPLLRSVEYLLLYSLSSAGAET